MSLIERAIARHEVPAEERPGLLARLFGRRRDVKCATGRTCADRKADVESATARADGDVARLEAEQRAAMDRAIQRREAAIAAAKAKAEQEHEAASRGLAGDIQAALDPLAARWVGGDTTAARALADAVAELGARSVHEFGQPFNGERLDLAFARAHGLGDRVYANAPNTSPFPFSADPLTVAKGSARAVFVDAGNLHTPDILLVEALKAYELALLKWLQHREENPELCALTFEHADGVSSGRRCLEYFSVAAAEKAHAARVKEARATLATPEPNYRKMHPRVAEQTRGFVETRRAAAKKLVENEAGGRDGIQGPSS